MKGFLEQEKAALQQRFEEFHKRGSWMAITDADGANLGRALVDSYRITRVLPIFSAAGQHKATHFWLFFKDVGYHEGFQHAHTVKIVAMQNEDWAQMDLTDDRGRRFHIEVIEPSVEPDEAIDWKNWQRFREENPWLARVDGELLEEHMDIAEEWSA